MKFFLEETTKCWERKALNGKRFWVLLDEKEEETQLIDQELTSRDG
jgi:hypothetical protein